MILARIKRALKSVTVAKEPAWSNRSRHPLHWFKWLVPGLVIKRWLLISVGGVLLTVLGIAIAIKQTPVFHLLQFAQDFAENVAHFLPNSVSGPVVILLGLALIWLGQTRTLGSIIRVVMPEGDEELVDVLLAHHRLHRGPKIVGVGGGTGLSVLLRGMKEYSANITAIVTVADDGGSSGRLRREIGVLPPGDIRNCLAALADEEKLLTELFQYRFRAGDGLSGHSFGNLFLSALSDITGDLEKAINASSEVLAVRGRVIPATLSHMGLWAEFEDGRRVEGESQITAARGRILKIGSNPPNPAALPSALKAIQEADYLIFGPGSLYTSVIPNLLVPEILKALLKSRAPRIYVCNIMTQVGETTGYKVSDHLKAIFAISGPKICDAVLVQKRPPSPATLRRYAQEGCYPVELDREGVHHLGCRVVLADVMEEDQATGLVRHHSQKLAGTLLRWYGRQAQRRRVA